MANIDSTGHNVSEIVVVEIDPCADSRSRTLPLERVARFFAETAVSGEVRSHLESDLVLWTVAKKRIGNC